MTTIRVEVQSNNISVVTPNCFSNNEVIHRDYFLIQNINYNKGQLLERIQTLDHEILFDPIFQEIIYDETKDILLDKTNLFVIDICFLPGVTDNKANSLKDALNIIKIESNIASGKLFLINTKK
ncbi:MAG: hypothetical protein HOJ35_05935, partial [Bdellovibrionales bacterium]|nr:hypothetical protein [Bdellovibrionales bacterium]